jgi:WD40 repeat protein
LPGSGAPIEKLRFGPTEPVLLAEYRGGVGNQIAVWNWQTRQKRFGLPHGSNAEAIDFSPDGGRLAVGRPDGWLMVYSTTNGDLLEKRELTLNSGAARAPQAVRFSPSGDLLAECSLHDYYVRIWTTGASHPVARLYHTDFVHDLAWHPGGELLATACRDALVYLWTTNETVKPRKLGKLGHEGCVTAVAFNRRGTVLASAGLDETTRLWFPATEEQAVRSSDGEHFDRLRFSGQDKLLVATGNRQTSARVWDVLGAEYVPLRLLAGPAERIKNIDFSPDGRWLAGAIGERAGIWDATSGSEAGRLNFGSAKTPAAWFSADSRSLLTPTVDGLFRSALVSRGDASPPRVDWEAAQQINGVTNELRAMSVTPSRRLAAIARHDEVLLVSFDPQNACSLRTIPVEVHYHQLALHPEGTWLAGMIGQSNSIHLWSLAENTGIRSPIILPASEHFTFSPDGRWLAVFWAGEFRFYRVGDWRQPAFAISRTTASGQHSPLAFAGDGATIALASSRYAIQLLRLPEDGSGPPMLLASLEGSDRSPLEMLAFSPDGRMLAAVTQSQVVQLWNLALLRDGLAALDLQNGWTNYP